MPYCALADLVGRRIPEATLIQLTDDAGLGVVDTTVVDAILAEASEVCDGYLRGRYAVPLSPVPQLLTAVALSIVLYLLYGRRPELGATPERIKDDYQTALKQLAQMQTGVIVLDAPTPAGADPVTGSGASFVGQDRRFSRDSLKDGF